MVSSTPWNDIAGEPSELTKSKGCGENRFVGIINILEFFLEPGCEVVVEPRDAIMTKVRMEWTMEEFYADGGTTRFVDRIAAALGIDRSRVKVVAAYEGSVIVDFFIEALTTSEEDASKAERELASLTDKITEAVVSGSIDLGAPVLGLEGDGDVLAGDPIPVVGGTNGSGSTAIRRNDNVWDRYTRVQQAIDKQKESRLYDSPIITADDAATSSELSREELDKQNEANIEIQI